MVTSNMHILPALSCCCSRTSRDSSSSAKAYTYSTKIPHYKMLYAYNGSAHKTYINVYVRTAVILFSYMFNNMVHGAYYANIILLKCS